MAALIGFVCYGLLKNQVFPVAPLNLQLSRSEIQERANQLARKVGYGNSGVLESTVFSCRSDAKNFLEHEYSRADANRLMSSEIPVWAWKTRLCREFDQEEFRCALTPEGDLLSFSKDVPNDVVQKSMTRDEALAIGIEFLKRTEPTWTAYDVLIDENVINGKKRTDYWFEWENRKQDYKGAHKRLTVTVTGGRVVQYARYLHIPEKWNQQFLAKRAPHNLLDTLASSISSLVDAISLIIVVWGIVTRNVRWKFALLGSFALSVVAAIDYWNGWPDLMAAYSTNVAYNQYVIGLVTSGVTGILTRAAGGFVTFGAAEIAYRSLFPKCLSMESLFSGAGLSSSAGIKGMLIGNVSVGVVLGWITLYYLVGQTFLYWCPQRVEEFRILSDLVPCISAIAVGIRASFLEEFASRVIGLFLGMKLFRNFWLANFVQAAVWGIGHSFYPQEPFYARPVELTVVGLLYGWLLRRYGLLACLSAHYLIDAFFSSEPLLHSGSTDVVLSALPALALGLLLFLVALFWNSCHRRSKTSVVINEDIQFNHLPAASLEVAQQQYSYKPLSSKMRLSMFLLAVASAGTWLFIVVEKLAPAMNDNQPMLISRKEAVDRAKQVMKKHNIRTDGWMITSWCSKERWDVAYQYMFEKVGFDRTQSIYKELRTGYRFGVRFFKPSEVEQYTVSLRPDGEEDDFYILKAEDAQGVSLDAAAARRLAEQQLRAVDQRFSQYQFASITPTNLNHRTDYYIQFEDRKLDVADAVRHLGVSVIGDQAGSVSQWWSVPDLWLFERSKSRIIDAFTSPLRKSGQLLVPALACFWCIALVRKGQLQVRPALAITAVWLFFLVADRLNELPELFWNYSSTMPLLSYLGEKLISNSGGILETTLRSFVLILLVLATLPLLPGGASPRSFCSQVFGREDTIAKKNIWMDAVMISLALALLNMMLVELRLFANLSSPLVPWHDHSRLERMMNDAIPLLTPILSALMQMAERSGSLIIAVAIGTKLLPKYTKLCIIGVVLETVVGNSGCRYWQDFVISSVDDLIFLSLAYVAITKIARNNYLAYALYFFTNDLLKYIIAICLLGGDKVFMPELMVSVALVLAPVAYAGWLQLRPCDVKSDSGAPNALVVE